MSVTLVLVDWTRSDSNSTQRGGNWIVRAGVRELASNR